MNITGLGEVRPARCLEPDALARVGEAEPRAFTEAEYAGRIARIRAGLTELGADAILVFRPSSVDYLSGYFSAETAPQPLLVTADALYLYVLDLEIGRAVASSVGADILYCDYSTMHRALEAICGHVARVLPQTRRLAIDTSAPNTPPIALEALRTAGVSIVDADNLVERQRLVLSPAELDHVRAAAEITQRGVDAAVAAAREPGVLDNEVGAAISEALLREADSKSAWGPVVATGARGGIAHSTWRGTPLEEVTFIEFAGTHRRYHAPVMRTLCRGEPPEKARRLEALAGTAVAAVLDAARPGVPCSRVAEHALRELGPLRDDEVFHHMFGYPIGIAHPPHWMDGAPFYLTTANEQPLQAGMVFHIPASFRSFGVMGVGLSQTFTVTENGACALTHGSPELIPI
ncbi:M24 family metallopeptidase [Sciscionella sediminilitoris]|uniref:M24 family metallopeptidase n=1 Tax=Sciscionella sediminilitoris TaxID=1445613 RepID=UPI0004DED611|nr:Xaa-Pro peptidase family protein [Sciscionella sp. SE31]